MRSCWFWLKRQFWHVLPVFVFFFFAFNIINATESNILKRAGIPPFTVIDIFISALLIAKIYLVVDHFSVLRWLSNQPLIYFVLWKTAIYGFLTLAVRVCIRFWHFMFLGEGFEIEWETFVSNLDWYLFFTIQAWFLMLFFLFVMASELACVIGYEKMRRILFKKTKNGKKF